MFQLTAFAYNSNFSKNIFADRFRLEHKAFRLQPFKRIRWQALLDFKNIIVLCGSLNTKVKVAGARLERATPGHEPGMLTATPSC